MSGYGGKNIATVESAALLRGTEVFAVNFVDWPLGPVEDKAEEAIVRADPGLIIGFKGQRAALGTYAWVNDGQMCCPRWKFTGGVAQGKCGGEYVLWGDLMRDID
jgi:hypothetical protein